MNQVHCERDHEVAEVLQKSWMNSELSRHIENCETCAEARDVAEVLLADARLMARRLELPGSKFVWHRAQTHARDAAFGRAMRPMSFMYLALVAYGVVFASWWVGKLAQTQHHPAFPVWNGLSTFLMLAGTILVSSSIFLGLWYSLREDQPFDKLDRMPGISTGFHGL